MKVFLKILFVAAWLLSGASLWGITALPDSIACDSIFLHNGNVYAVKDLSWNDSILRYVDCQDRWKTIHTLRWQEVKRVKKADGTAFFSPPPPEPGRPMTEAEQSLEKKVMDLSTLSKLILPLLLLGGLGIFLIPVVLIKAARLKNKVKGHAHEKQLLERIARARKRALGILIGYLVVGVLFFAAVFSFFAKFEHR